MKKISMMLLMTVMASMSVMAKSLVLTLTDGSLVYYQLGGETNPKMRFVEGKLTVEADAFEFSGIKNFYISNEDAPDAIEQTEAEQMCAFHANSVTVKASSLGAVKVFSSNGSQVKPVANSVGDYVNIDLSGLPNGAYVISVGKSAFKVLKR